MATISMECIVPFPVAGIECPTCHKIQRDSSTFKTHARRVHKVAEPQTPTTCSICGQKFRTFRAGSAHFAKKHAEANPKPPAAASPSPYLTCSQDMAAPPTMATPPPATSPEMLDVLGQIFNRPNPATCLSVPAPTRARRIPTSSRKLIRLLTNSPPQPRRPMSPATTAEPTTSCSTDAARLLSPDVPPPIPLHSRSTICPNPEPQVNHLIRHYRNNSRQNPPCPSPPSMTLASGSLSNDDFCSHPPRPTSLPLLTSPNGSPLPSPDHPMTQVAPSPNFVSPSQQSASSLPTTSSPQPNPPQLSPQSPVDLNLSTDATIPVTHGEQLQEFHKHWSVVFSANLQWLEFSEQCEAFASAVRSLANSLNQPQPPPAPSTRPNQPRRPPNGRPVNRFDPSEARRLQSLYRKSKKRAARKILANHSIPYAGSRQTASDFFTTTFGERPCDTEKLLNDLQTAFPPSSADHSHLVDEVTHEEIKQKLGNASNTAPGSDRVEYRHLKRVDPQAKILHLIFNRCLREKDVPTAWKDAVTILIYKKGSPTDPSNFRPIALMSCIYKLLMGVLGKRLSNWAIQTHLLSDEQKSARPTEGCYQHTFLLQSVIRHAKVNKRSVYVAWLDLRNAFGSLPHDAVSTTLQHLGVPDDLISLISNVYTGATTTVRLGQDTTEPIPIRAGVKQGCPMSAILFNLCIELIIRTVKQKASSLPKHKSLLHHNTLLSCLAYADDLVLVARSKDALQALLDSASSAASVLGLEFRPDKCASLSLINRKDTPIRIEDNDFTIQTHHIPALTAEESYRYLGVPIGMIHNINDLDSILPQMIEDLEAIRASCLAPWQKIDAIRTFVQPCLTYAIRAGNPQKDSIKPYRKCLVKTLREICDLPQRSTQAYFFAQKSVGGLALQDPNTEVDIQCVVQAVRLLAADDPTVAAIAKADLLAVVRRSLRCNLSPNLVSKYLSGDTTGPLANLAYTYSSLWSRCRVACRNLKVKFVFTDDEPPAIVTDEAKSTHSKNVCSFLHRLVQQRVGKDLMDLNDQGKVARCLVADQYGNGSTWHNTGLNLRFKDWRFVHKARLNCLPTNAVKARWSNTAPTCRNCTETETLPHVINHCHPAMSRITDRHNKLVTRITDAVRSGTVTTDRAVADSGLPLRPDIIVEEQDRVLIIDVTCPFDNGPDALQDAALSKTTKYQPLKEYFLSLNKTCEIYPFVVGSLGSWFPDNEALLRQLDMSSRYKSLFRKLCCTDAIQGSCDIFRIHMGWDVPV